MEITLLLMIFCKSTPMLETWQFSRWTIGLHLRIPIPRDWKIALILASTWSKIPREIMAVLWDLLAVKYVLTTLLQPLIFTWISMCYALSIISTNPQLVCWWPPVSTSYISPLGISTDIPTLWSYFTLRLVWSHNATKRTQLEARFCFFAEVHREIPPWYEHWGEKKPFYLSLLQESPSFPWEIA